MKRRVPVESENSITITLPTFGQVISKAVTEKRHLLVTLKTIYLSKDNTPCLWVFYRITRESSTVPSN